MDSVVAILAETKDWAEEWGGRIFSFLEKFGTENPDDGPGPAKRAQQSRDSEEIFIPDKHQEMYTSTNELEYAKFNNLVFVPYIEGLEEL